jgi:hypothetical protein
MSKNLKEIFNKNKNILSSKEQSVFEDYYLNPKFEITSKNGRVLFSAIRKLRNNLIKLPQFPEKDKQIKTLIKELEVLKPKVNKVLCQKYKNLFHLQLM